MHATIASNASFYSSRMFGPLMSLLESRHELSRILSAVDSRFADNQFPSAIYGQVDAVHTDIFDDVLDGRGHLVDRQGHSGKGGVFEQIVGEEGRKVASHGSDDDC